MIKSLCLKARVEGKGGNMIFELFLVPTLLGLVVNGTSQYIFKEKDLNQIIYEIYNEAVKEFDKKYEDLHGGKYNRFTARQDNMDVVLAMALEYKKIDDIKVFNSENFDGTIIPDIVARDFLSIFNKKLENDHRLFDYREKKAHNVLTEEILHELRKYKTENHKKFVSIMEYVDNIEIIDNSKRSRDLISIEESINLSRITLLDSFRGYGKTHTLLALANNSKLLEVFDEVIIMKHGLKSIYDALQTELIQGRKYLLLIDDVELCLEEFIEVLNYMREEEIKVVVTSQTFKIEEIKREIIKKGYAVDLNVITLNNWEKDDYIELLRKTAKNDNVEDEDTIVVKYPSPPLVAIIGTMIEKTSKIDIEDYFVDSMGKMESDTYDIFSGSLDEDKCKKLLFSISCIVPFVQNEETISLLSKVNSIEESKIKEFIGKMECGGILRIVGYQYRFFPDFKGDIYLAYSLKNNAYPKVLEYLINKIQAKVLVNINEARKICNVDVNEILEKVIEEWGAEESYYEQIAILDRAKNIISFAPCSVLNLLYYYLNYAIVSKDETYAKLTSDNFTPLLLELWYYSEDKEAILEFIAIMREHNLDGMYSNNKVDGLIGRILSPINTSTEDISFSLELIVKWIISGKKGSLELFKYAVSEIMKASHEVTKSIINGVQFGQKVMKYSPEIVALRQDCIKHIDYLIDEKYDFDTMKVIENICNNLGVSNWKDSIKEEIPLYDTIITERKQIVDIMGNKLIISDEIDCNIIIDKILYRWWLLQYIGTENIEKYLNKFIRTPEYLTVNYYVNMDYYYASFENIRKEVPLKERWSWFVHNKKHDEKYLNEGNLCIAQALNEKIQTIEDFTILINNVGAIITKIGREGVSPSILKEWCKINLTLFLDFVNSENYWKADNILRADVLLAVAIVDEKNKHTLTSEKLDEFEKLSNEEIIVVLRILEDDSLDEEFIIIAIKNIIANNKTLSISYIIHRLYFIFKNRRSELLVSELIVILQTYALEGQTLNMFDFILKQYLSDFKKSDEFLILKNMLIDKLVDVKEYDYYENSILEQLLTNKDEAMDYIVRRLNGPLNDNINKVPYNGFEFMGKFLKDEAEYERFISIIIRLDEEGEIDSYDKDDLFKEMLTKKGNNDDLIIMQVMKKYIEIKNIRGVLEILRNIKLSEGIVNEFIEGVVYIDSEGMGKEAENLIRLHKNVYNGYSRKINQDSPELLSKLRIYSEISEKIPYGKLKMVSKECIKDIKANIENDKIRDAMIMNPR